MRSPGVWLAAILGILLGVGATAMASYALTHGAITARFVAKELCSCLYVAGQPEAFCRDYAKVGPTWFLQVQVKRGRVESSAFLLLRASATYQGQRSGCALDP